jgi:Holliday junction resolvase RusA-like endonuclease
MTLSFTIPTRLPGANEIIDAARDHWSRSAKQKKTWTGIVVNCLANRYEGKQLGAFSLPVWVYINWYEPNEKRDPDNIMAGQKFIFDGLVAAGILKGDGFKHVRQITHQFHVDAKNPRVEIRISEG